MQEFTLDTLPENGIRIWPLHLYGAQWDPHYQLIQDRG